eukprot:jgi/Mesvir1/27604/Mv26397-RA.1
MSKFAIYDLDGFNNKPTNVFEAAEKGDVDLIFKFTKSKGFQIDAKVRSLFSVAFYFCALFMQPTLICRLAGNFCCCLTLYFLDAKPLIFCRELMALQDKNGRTALMWAADCGQLDGVMTLLRLGASVNVTDMHNSRTAMHWAARAGDLACVQALAEHGADVDVKDKYGLTPLYLASQKGPDGEKVFKYLLERGAEYNEYTAKSLPKEDPADSEPQEGGGEGANE